MKERKQERKHSSRPLILLDEKTGRWPSLEKMRELSGQEHIECPSCHSEWLKLIDNSGKMVQDRKLFGHRRLPEGIFMGIEGGKRSAKLPPTFTNYYYYQCPKCKARWMHDVMGDSVRQWSYEKK